MGLKQSKAKGPSFTEEQLFKGNVCGIDEAGRGPLAGPVVASCVFIHPDQYNSTYIQEINDSKKLSKKKREQLYEYITSKCIYGIGNVSAEEVDTLNIHNASLLAMRRAYLKLINKSIKIDMALIDGRFIPKLPCQSIPLFPILSSTR